MDEDNLIQIINLGRLFSDPNNFIAAAIKNKKSFKKKLVEQGIKVPRTNKDADEFMSKILRALWECLREE